MEERGKKPPSLRIYKRSSYQNLRQWSLNPGDEQNQNKTRRYCLIVSDLGNITYL